MPPPSLRLRSLHRWLLVQAVVWPPLLGWMAWMPDGLSAWPGAVLGAFAISSYAVLVRLLGVRTLADVVTVARLTGVVLVAVLIVTSQRVEWWAWAALCALVAADLVDGWLARRFGGSASGAVLDMETDQLAMVALALLAVGIVGLGGWVLVVPGFRYASVLLRLSLQGWSLDGAAHDPKPKGGDNRLARWLCALVNVCLLIIVVPDVAHPVATGAALTAVFALAVSHGSDAWYLVRRRGAMSTG